MNIFDSLPKIPFAQSEPDYDCGDGAAMKLFRDISQADFESYQALLADNGFEKYDSHQIENNTGVTFTGNGILVHLVYSGCDSTLRVIADPNTALLQSRAEKCAEKCPTVLYQFETDHSLIDCGMCYIFQCCDGSFFIIDSAHFYSVNDNDRIHDFLRERTPEGEKIRIAGWFFSHGHTDHICKAADYISYNCADTEIECVYLNLIPTTHRDSVNWDTSEKRIIEKFSGIINARPEIKRVKLHSLQHFFVRNLEFEVLCTHEDIYPLSVADFNDSSTALMVTACGSRICLPGDSSRNASDVMTSRFRTSLKCDIMQLSHHGHTGCRKEFYERADASLLLVPNTKIKFDEEWERREENRYAVGIADEWHISSEGTVGVPLPYEKGKTIVYPDETTEDFDGIFSLWNYEYSDEMKRSVADGFNERHNRKI